MTFPANDAARIQAVKDDGTLNIRDIERALRDVGLSQQQAKALIADGYRALRDVPTDDENDDVQAVAQWLREARKELRV